MTRMITTREFANRAGVTVDHVSDMCRSGRMPGARRYQIGGNAAWAVPEHLADNYIKGNPGRKKAVQTSPIRNAIKARLSRGSVSIKQLAQDLEVTEQLIRIYLKQLGAKKDKLTGLYK